MGSRKKRRLQEEAARLADPFSPPEPPLAGDPLADAQAPLETEPPAGLFCAYCGSAQLRESIQRGARERWLGLGGASVYRCENCGRRLALAALATGRRELARRRRSMIWATVALGLLTFLTVAWLIYRTEQRRLEVEGVQAVP